jgi:hypothetical protein
MPLEPVDHINSGLFLYPRIVFDPAFIGWGRRPGDPTPITIYAYLPCVNACMKWYNMSHEEAAEYVTAQVESYWRGPSTPMIISTGIPADLEALL